MLYVDIDQLNVINENHGMHVGDEVIQDVANLLSRRAREGTLVARVGADRFCMFVPGCGIEPAARSPEEFAQYMRVDLERSERLLRAANFTPQ